jgi:DNA primase
MARIPRAFIDQLLDRLDIVEVINARVPLRRQGAEYAACCPFHGEKTPSFFVSPSKQFYHCFGCGAHGTAFDFVMEQDRLSFPEAVEELASSIGMTVPKELEGIKPNQHLKPLYDINTQARDFYLNQLRTHPDAQQAIDYLKSRGLTGKTAAAFGLGYAPGGWDSLLKALSAQGWSTQQMLQAGLVSEPEPGKVYDRLRERIIFPIHDLRGRVIGFGGRLLVSQAAHQGQTKAPKYLNSPETPLFHKGHQLYGLYEARKALRQPERLLIVEGYMDVVMLAQHGIHYAVATLGTATTAEHLELLFRHCGQLVFCFDGDRAGREAAWKALKLCLPQLSEGREVRFLFLPEGEDPDSLVQKEGQAAFEARIKGATALSDYLFAQIGEGLDLGSNDGRARYAELMRPYLQQLPQGILAQMLWQRLARIIELPLDALQPGLGQARAPSKASHKASHPRGQNARTTPARLAITLLLKQPELAVLDNLPVKWQQLDKEGIPLLRELFWYIEEHPGCTSAQILEAWREHEHQPHLYHLSGQRLDIPESGYQAEFRGCLTRLEQEESKAQLNQLIATSKTRPLTPDETERLLQLSRRQ